MIRSTETKLPEYILIPALIVLLAALLVFCSRKKEKSSEAPDNLERLAPADSDSVLVDSLAAISPDHGIVPYDSLPADAVERISNYFADHLSARYMEGQCDSTRYPGWEGFPLIKCRYSVTDQDGTQKSAEVIMLNPSPDQLARWVVNTCLVVKGSADARYTDKLSHHIINQSGAQFPIAGIVFEDILPADGVYEMYCFRNGVTVGIEGVTHRGTGQPGEEQIYQSLYGRVTWTGKYARLQDTTREQYRANGGTMDVGDSSREKRKISWLEVSRDLYQAAWGKNRNELMIAWARDQL